jgi:hypothetical protein
LVTNGAFSCISSTPGPPASTAIPMLVDAEGIVPPQYLDYDEGAAG